MSDLILRDVDEYLIQKLTAQATAQGTSVEEYAKTVLTSQTPPPKRLSRAELVRKADEFRKKVGPQKTDSTQLIREDRDSR